MHILSWTFEEFKQWLAFAGCCCASTEDSQAVRGEVKSMKIEFDQPRLVPSPTLGSRVEIRSKPSLKGPKVNHIRGKDASYGSSIRGSSRPSSRKRSSTFNGTRRGPRKLQVSSPSNFRHVQSGYPIQRRVPAFRPLELSIYLPENRLSPLLPLFCKPATGEDAVPPKPAPRSDSAASFGIQRKPIRSKSPTEALPAYKRVKSAVWEKVELEQRLKDIEEVIEKRKSIYMNSWPTSRATARLDTRPISIYSESQEPMPKSAIDLIDRPPMPTLTKPWSADDPFDDQEERTYTPLTSHPTSSIRYTKAPPLLKERPLPPPPLPLILQKGSTTHPPLRKMKSFSRVSSWLSISGQQEPHYRSVSLDSITNTPKPITSREGFYQCVEVQNNEAGNSTTSIDTVSPLSMTSESEVNGTVPTTLSPDSSPGRSLKRETRRFESIDSSRVGINGSDTKGTGRNRTVEEMPCPPGHGRDSVGVAF